MISVLRHARAAMTKTWNADGSMTSAGKAAQFKLREVEIGGLPDLSRMLSAIESDPQTCIVRGKWVGADEAARRDPDEYKRGLVHRSLAQFDDQPLHAVLIDVDKFVPLGADPVTDPEGAVREFVACCLPECFAERSVHWQLSSSAGSRESVAAGTLKAHLWFWLEVAYGERELTAWVRAEGLDQVDVTTFRTVQVHYTALPVFAAGVADPVARRSGWLDGLAGDVVPLVIDEATLARADALAGAVGGAGGAGGLTQRHEVLRGALDADPVVRELTARGLVRSMVRGGGLNIECPFAELHTGGGGDTSTQYFPPNTGGYARGNFKCMHAHCGGRGRREWLARLGIFEDLDDVAGAFSVVQEVGGGVGSGPGAGGPGGGSAGGGGGSVGGGSGGADDGGLVLKGIPEAKHLCTDQANAGRLVARFGRLVLVTGGRWHTWDGRRWVADEGDVYRYACQLSRIVRAEAAKLRAEVSVDVAANARRQAVALALDRWEAKCEMRGTIEAAVGLARKMLTVDESVMDRDPWLLNCENGTVDLRTGVLREHRATDYITRLAGVPYVADARCDRWQRTLGQVAMDEGVAAFLQRWFGYCATALTREQVFVVHFGGGSNGKSTVLDMVAHVLGDYAGTAAPGLLMGGGRDRHPTEIADLLGRRMVTAHETGDGGVLREDFVKQATGGDKLKGRLMGADFFEFRPTHKLQLLTNHKPAIRGQDVGIWRRVLLVPYVARFGSGEDVRTGRAGWLKDVGLMDALMTEAVGVLAWVVQGAVRWAAEGLQPPGHVLAASKDYQTEQDRVGQFLSECCELGPDFSESLTAGLGLGLFPAYVDWCKEAGFIALAKNRFLAEIERAVPGCQVVEKKVNTGGTRRLVRQVRGVRVLLAE